MYLWRSCRYLKVLWRQYSAWKITPMCALWLVRLSSISAWLILPRHASICTHKGADIYVCAGRSWLKENRLINNHLWRSWQLWVVWVKIHWTGLRFFLLFLRLCKLPYALLLLFIVLHLCRNFFWVLIDSNYVEVFAVFCAEAPSTIDIKSRFWMKLWYCKIFLWFSGEICAFIIKKIKSMWIANEAFTDIFWRVETTVYEQER